MYLRLMYLSSLINIILSFNITDYLYRYEYFDQSETTTTKLESALIKFQEFYNLQVDGTLNNDTIELMSRPRCGVSENPSEFYTYGNKWTKNQLFWYFAMADATMLKIANRVFDIWQNYTNLNFIYSIKNPDIIISFSDNIFVHKNNPRCMKGECLFPFDGKSGVLAHAFAPRQNKCIEIHLDKGEDWYIGFNKTPLAQTSLFKVLLHEVGHTLGIKHSSDPTSIMYAFYSENTDHLSKDDIEAIQYLYGKRKESSTTNTSTTTPASTTPATNTTNETNKTKEIKLDLCDIWTNKF
ncbi:Matrixin [Popillia japonica]|uniref:Matrixin n=1 Tax=Popillia japonica TaxID=7064 RepID=A0AAW1KLK6_POPJA